MQDSRVPVSPFIKMLGEERQGDTKTIGTGSIASGANSALITHGLGGVPLNVKITPMDGLDAPFEVTTAGLNATTFTVRYKFGVLQEAGTTGYFMWEALR